ncbi:probable ATP-dependent RNA helicase spindle-E [Nasonia vitripennis]|uniref:Probable ATP-dependent RNA helicase spindle-E n=1 Tax=Nasonia vitripennis TaxID=7425 RepID=A0A7M7H7X9_NASVI|nr:probable ATP-dependent RNA helicase spindle-E [Nasonia vitripennis]XP_032455581.1 probable ATP-dependent RNA helicase spindle-E [Nasonia vitripennis]
MDLLDLFQSKKPVERVNVSQHRIFYVPDESSDARSEASFHMGQLLSRGVDYSKKYIDEENEKALQTARISNTHQDGNKFDEMSVGTVPTHMTDADIEEKAKVYNMFDFEYRPKEELPIVQNKSEITSMIETHSITIIEGVTGCGKSTQVPQFILDSCYKERKHCNIIVTQPRRIAALSIADRVSKERGWHLGTLVGVQVGMYKRISEDTRLTYCTTGVLLRKLITAKNMLEYTHVILDEVHERDQEMDFLLLIIRKLLRTNSRQVKVILMSATFDVSKFAEYFSVPTETGFVAAPIVTIPKKRNYKVHTHYLCQLTALGTLPEISLVEPKVSEKMMKFCIKLINVFDDIDSNSEYDPEDLAEFGGEKPRYATLVFLPGIWEIEEMHDLMIQDSQSSKWDIVILHSSITSEEQNKIFLAPPKGCRRIILSTNIAESSITINNIKYVIDFCLTKQLVTDPGTNFQCLELTWASKANCEQRAGRTGRVMDGRVYRLIPKSCYQHLPSEGDPEIVRAPLENLVLQTKLLDMGEPKAVLALAIDPPDLTNLERTVLLLKESGGLLDKPNMFNRFDGELTDLGRIMAALPMDTHLAKLIALGHAFGVLRDTIVMAAAMAVKPMFSNPFQKRMEAYYAKVHWADGSTSDCLTFLNAFKVWQRNIASNYIKKKHHTERTWAKTNFLQVRVLHEVDYLVHELTMRLERLGIKETEGTNKVVTDEVDRSFVLKIVIAGAFYPNYFIRNQTSGINIDETQGTKALGGLDPTRTVFLQGWNPEQPGKLYAKRIQEIFKDVVPAHDQTVVEFDGSHRIYLMFNDDKAYHKKKEKVAKIPGKVSLSVYKALKLRKLRTQFELNVMDLRSAKQLAEELKLTTNTSAIFYSKDNFVRIKEFLPTTLPLLPSLADFLIPIKIIHSENPNKFWARMNEDDTWMKLSMIDTFLNDSKNITLRPFEYNPKIGSLVAAKWNNKMYRATIEGYYKIKGQDVANVFYIDFGSKESVPVSDLRTIKTDHDVYNIRALAFECTLTGIEPSTRQDARGLWSEKAGETFEEYTSAPYKVVGQVYSVVDGVVSLQLICTNTQIPQESVNLNDLLIKEGLADSVEEHYLSNYNHKLRESANDYLEEHREYLEYLQYDKTFLTRSYPDPPPVTDCRSLVYLKGPFSPLEINLSSLATVTATKKVNIDNLSVNSILVDTDPDDPHDRLLVASVVSQNTSGTYLTLRNTTLMPNIAGLTALICLIFSPKIELRRTSSGSRYIGALCGLGYNPRNCAALLPEHDMEVYFDTEISIEDMQNINRLRHWMNMGICVKGSEPDENASEDAIKCQRKVIEFLKKLTNRPVKDQKPEKILNFSRWCLYNDALFLHPTKAVIKEDSVFPLHCALQLEECDENSEKMAVHCQELRSLAISDPRIPENVTLHCQLCDKEVYSREELRLHLFMNEHKDREKSLGIQVSRYY